MSETLSSRADVVLKGTLTEDVRRNQFRTVYYRDVSAVFGQTDTEILIDDEDAVSNQIANLICTEIGSRGFEPLFGSRLPDLVWEPCDGQTAWLMESAIVDALTMWMSDRVVFGLRDIVVTPIPEQQVFDAKISYQIKRSGLNAVLRLRLSK